MARSPESIPPEVAEKVTAIHRTYYGYMYRIAMSILGNATDAEDAVQEAMVAVYKNIEKFFEVECPKTQHLIGIIVRGKAIDMLRGRSRCQEVPLEDYYLLPSRNHSLDSPLADALARLDPHYRDVILLRFADGYTIQQIAQLLEISTANVYKRISRGKAALGKLLEEEGVYP